MRRLFVASYIQSASISKGYFFYFVPGLTFILFVTGIAIFIKRRRIRLNTQGTAIEMATFIANPESVDIILNDPNQAAILPVESSVQ